MTNDLAKGFNNIIENYAIDYDNIYVKYLNGNIETYEYSSENIEKIVNDMVNQAKEIVKERTSDEFLYSRNLSLVETTLTTAAMAIVSSISIEIYCSNADIKRIIPELLATIAIPVIIYSTIKSGHKSDDLEVKKYQLFIENYNDFMNHNYNENTYYGIKKKGYVSINNLDSYTYDEVNKMVENIQRTRNK